MVPPSMHCAEGSRSATQRGKRSVEVSGEVASDAFLRRRSPRLLTMEQRGTGGQRGGGPVGVNGNVGGSTGKRGRGGGGEVRGGNKATGKSLVLEDGVVGANGEKLEEESVKVGMEQLPEMYIEELTRTSDEAKVKETVKLFNKTFLQCVQVGLELLR